MVKSNNKGLSSVSIGNNCLTLHVKVHCSSVVKGFLTFFFYPFFILMLLTWMVYAVLHGVSNSHCCHRYCIIVYNCGLCLLPKKDCTGLQLWLDRILSNKRKCRGKRRQRRYNKRPTPDEIQETQRKNEKFMNWYHLFNNFHYTLPPTVLWYVCTVCYLAVFYILISSRYYYIGIVCLSVMSVRWC